MEKSYIHDDQRTIFKCDLGALPIYLWIVLTNIDILLKVAGRFVFQKCNQTKF